MPQDNTPAYTPMSNSDKRLARYIKLFQLSWTSARPYFDMAQEDSLLFNQDIDQSTSPTMSEITLAQAKLYTDQILPVIMNVLFGSDNSFELIPASKGIDYGKSRLIRDWILYQMLTYMRLETTGYLSIKDAVKLGCGYGIIEPRIITPPESSLATAYAKGEKIETRLMGVGQPVMVPGYTYLTFGQTIPTPDGRTPDEVSCVFVLRMYPENKFRKMLNKRLNPNTPFEGDVEKIISAARSKLFNGYLNTPRMIAAQIANQQQPTTDAMNQIGEEDTPVIIPVLECYAPDEHVFYACDRFQIYHSADKFQTLRNPVIKATFDPDGNEWFTPGIIRPRRRMIMGIEAFYNAIMDILTMHLHPHQIVNRDSLVSEDDATGLQAYGKTFTTGSMRAADVIAWATPPALPPAILAIGEKLEAFDDASAGQPKALHGQGTPGLVRGGSGAMESLLQSSSGRDKMTAKHFENGWYVNCVEQTLILAQMLAGEKEFLPVVKYDEKKGKNDMVFEEIDRDDIRRIYEVRLTFSEKMTNQLSELNRAAMIYDRAIQNPNVSKKEAFALLIGNTKDYNRLTAGVDVEENIRQSQAMASKTPETAIPPEMPQVAGAGIRAAGLNV